MVKYKVGDLVNVRLSHSRVMTGLIIGTKDRSATGEQKTYIVHNMQNNRTAHAWRMDMELVSASR